MFLSLAALLAASALASPLASQPAARDVSCHGISGPFLGSSFPDPSITNEGGTWYSFGTGNGKDFQSAKTTDFKKGWTRFKKSPLLAIREATWAGQMASGSSGLWAPDVMRRTDGKYVMCVDNQSTTPHHRPDAANLSRYFAAQDKQKISQHCIGGAIADTIEGPYHPVNDFHQCNRTANGVIDPAWFKDADGSQYIVYKTEIPANFLEIREVASSGPAEGVRWIGNAVQLLRVNGQGFSDGNNIEAPYLFKRGGVYFLTYSTHITMDGSYDVQYATAKSVRGPYTRVREPLLRSGTQYGCKLVGPGGASFQRFVGLGKGEEGTRVVFHGLTEEMSINKRVVYTADVKVEGDRLSVPPSRR
ncbi:putative endo-arabinase [Paraphaeosphaeria minitans]|uniref:Endo-arabinase n=1 Tax=Paraphaeosphaeria minitans TaxID=565426 RepID=A0A9P6KNR6_9PLEO|nr:putative endo-arabinase [Paraphaeosphaeria minitans]